MAAVNKGDSYIHRRSEQYDACYTLDFRGMAHYLCGEM